jgi:hypothetical protein
MSSETMGGMGVQFKGGYLEDAGLIVITNNAWIWLSNLKLAQYLPYQDDTRHFFSVTKHHQRHMNILI